MDKTNNEKNLIDKLNQRQRSSTTKDKQSTSSKNGYHKRVPIMVNNKMKTTTEAGEDMKSDKPSIQPASVRVSEDNKPQNCKKQKEEIKEPHEGPASRHVCDNDCYCNNECSCTQNVR